MRTTSLFDQVITNTGNRIFSGKHSVSITPYLGPHTVMIPVNSCRHVSDGKQWYVSATMSRAFRCHQAVQEIADRILTQNSNRQSIYDIMIFRKSWLHLFSWKPERRIGYGHSAAMFVVVELSEARTWSSYVAHTHQQPHLFCKLRTANVGLNIN